MASIISPTVGEATSADFTLSPGDSATLALYGAGASGAGGSADIFRKVGSNSVLVGTLRAREGDNIRVLQAAGTYYVKKAAGANTGVDLES